MHAEILESIKDVAPEAWDEIAPADRLICRHDYLKAIEDSRINDCRYFYPLVRDNGNVVAQTCVYFISTELDTFATGVVKKSITAVRRFWPGFLILRSVECGTPVALGATICFRDGADRNACLDRIVSAVEVLAGRLGVRVILFRDFYAEETGFYDRIRGMGYRRIRNLPSVHLQVKWSSFEEYLADLRSPYRHKTIERMRKFTDSGCRVEELRDFGPVAGDLARLWLNAYRHAKEYRRERLLADFFVNVDRGLGARSSVILAKRGNDIVAFALLLHDGPRLEWLFCGLDYACSRDCCVYFNIMYKIVETAIRGGYKSVDLGITTVVPKMDIGGCVVEQYMYMKHLNPVLNQIVPGIFDMMTPRTSAKSRKVFRQ